MNKKYLYINNVIKTTTRKEVFLIKTNIPSITKRKGYDFSDTYKAAVVQSFKDIERNMLTDRKDPKKIGYIELVTIEEHKLKFAKKLTLTTGPPLDMEDMRELQITKDSLIATGHRRFIIWDDNTVTPFEEKDLPETSMYFVLHPLDEKKESFDLYQIEVSPDVSVKTVFNYKGDSKKVECSEFEFLYNDNGDFIGIKNLDKVESE